MARFAAAFVSSGAGSATLPLGSLYATAACRPRLVEVHVTNTTSTALTVILQRLTTAGTAAAVTETYEDDNSQTNVAQVVNTHTVAPTLGGALRRATLGAFPGAGVIWTFGGGKTPGLIIPNTTGDGIGVIPAGTGQVCDLAFCWDE